ncbi:DUF6702 family protein [Candidatus Latescibacterota bacterium]
MRSLTRAAALGVLAAALLPTTPAAAHPIYIGRISAALGDSALSGRISVNRLDFLQALAPGRSVRLHELSRAQLDSLSLRYLQARLGATADGDTLALDLEGSGQQRDEVWFDFTFPVLPAPEELTLRVAVLFELPEQKNLVELQVDSQVFRRVLTPPSPSGAGSAPP